MFVRDAALDSLNKGLLVFLFRLAFAFSIAILAASPAAAVITVSASAGFPDPGIPSGFTRVVTFDAPSATGIVNTISGTVITAAGDIVGTRFAPAGTPRGGVYQSVGPGGVSTFDFGSYLPANRVLTGFSLYWGSADRHNFLDFLRADNSLVATYAGSSWAPIPGTASRDAKNNPRVTFLMDGFHEITKVRMRSNGNAFEYDNLAVIDGSLPEPGSWAMMIVGFGLMGSVRRRRRALADA